MIATVFRTSVMAQLHRLALVSTTEERMDLDRELADMEAEIKKLRTAIADVSAFERWYATDVAARQMQ